MSQEQESILGCPGESSIITRVLIREKRKPRVSRERCDEEEVGGMQGRGQGYGFSLQSFQNEPVLIAPRETAIGLLTSTTLRYMKKSYCLSC